MAKDCSRKKIPTRAKCLCGECKRKWLSSSETRYDKFRKFLEKQKKLRKKQKGKQCAIWTPGFTSCRKPVVRNLMKTVNNITKALPAPDARKLAKTLWNLNCKERIAQTGERCGSEYVLRNSTAWTLSSCDESSILKLQGPRGTFEWRVDFTGVKVTQCSPDPKKVDACGCKLGVEGWTRRRRPAGCPKDSTEPRCGCSKGSTTNADEAMACLGGKKEKVGEQLADSAEQPISYAGELTCEKFKDKMDVTEAVEGVRLKVKNGKKHKVLPTAMEVFGLMSGWCFMPNEHNTYWRNKHKPRDAQKEKPHERLARVWQQYKHSNMDIYDYFGNELKHLSNQTLAHRPTKYFKYFGDKLVPTADLSLANPAKKSAVQCLNRYPGTLVANNRDFKAARKVEMGELGKSTVATGLTAMGKPLMVMPAYCKWALNLTSCRTLSSRDMTVTMLRAFVGPSYLSRFARYCYAGPPTMPIRLRGSNRRRGHLQA